MTYFHDWKEVASHIWIMFELNLFHSQMFLPTRWSRWSLRSAPQPTHRFIPFCSPFLNSLYQQSTQSRHVIQSSKLNICTRLQRLLSECTCRRASELSVYWIGLARSFEFPMSWVLPCNIFNSFSQPTTLTLVRTLPVSLTLIACLIYLPPLKLAQASRPIQPHGPNHLSPTALQRANRLLTLHVLHS